MPSDASFLERHNATLTGQGGTRFELGYQISAPSFGERVIDCVDVALPVVAKSEEEALRLAEVILREHKPPQLPEAQLEASELPTPLTDVRQLFMGRAALKRLRS